MQIDIFAHWKGQNESEQRAQYAALSKLTAGKVGYLFESYDETEYPTRVFCEEAFEDGEARISAALLRERLPYTLTLVERREREVYHSDEDEVEAAKQSFRDFVALCEQKEKETGEPVVITAKY